MRRRGGYCKRASQYLGDLIGAACTLNEANIALVLAKSRYLPPAARLRQVPWWSATADALGITPDRLAPFVFAGSDRAVETILNAHCRAVESIKAGPGDFPVGLTLALQDIQAGEGGEEIASQMRQEINGVYLKNVREDDFVGVQTYSRMRFGPEGPLPPEEGVELTQMGYEFWPEALEATIRCAASVTGIPVIVTENGIATADDTRRIEYIERALHAVANCLKDGSDVRGYTYWSALDNFEWMQGYRPTFGLIAVDRETQKRAVKPSARWLGAVARANRLPISQS